MEKTVLENGIVSLGKFVRSFIAAGVRNSQDWKTYCRENVAAMNEYFWYTQEKSMPGVYSLVNAAFHPEEQLVLLNYTPVAHNTLFAHQNGWTVPLRLCRGIIFDFEGNLVAKGFHKFFNFRENVETKELPQGDFEATKKMDGHLGIIFEYRGKLFVTTRGSFVSSTSKIATKMLAGYAKKYDWKTYYPTNVSLLVEIIHPATRVLTEYGDREEFVIIGAFNRENMKDYSHYKLCFFGKILNLPVTEIIRGKNLDELVSFMKDRSVQNEEGYVVRFDDGFRVKLKFETYIAKMIESKINYSYLMRKFVVGRLAETIDLLDEEILDSALKMLGEIMVRVSKPGTPKTKWNELYNLVSKEEATSSFQNNCRAFVKSLIGVNPVNPL